MKSNNGIHGYIDNGFYHITDAYAKELCGGKLPQHGYEKKVECDRIGKTGYVWVARTRLSGKIVWSIRECREYL